MGIKVDFTPAGGLVKHGGSGTAYANYGCRCEECQEANTERTKRRRRERVTEEPPADSHGKPSTYSNWGCKCVECVAAGAVHNKKHYDARKKKASQD